ncbi:cation:proton antiporter [Paenibacillus sp. BC26]|uniref:cation:proton antiporter n=1 Tax=Paenibacillus sp. BC26 TaxID=1881032 RepID=UPI0008F3E440|nr:cation:proton antiporter [Paenibacillus sp. BC26]SFS45961.1 sodium/proton-potassium antiporter GerN, CPA2 family [Paenibacillus sp. BC26]
MELYLQLAIVILATKLAGDLSVRLGQPSVLGKLVIGVILGPAVLGWVQSTEVIEAFSHIGVLLLMFFAGLETDIKDLNDNRNASAAVAIGGILLPLLGGYLAGIVMGMETSEAVFIGLLLSATSVSISVQTFKELGWLKSKESTTVLGAALVDDIVVVLTLAVMMSLLTASDVSLTLVIGKKVVFFILIGLLGWKVVPFTMRKLSQLNVTESVMSTALVLCLFFAYIAEYLGVAGIIGSFAAGIAISQTKFKKEVETRLEPIAYTIFVPVFFVSIGLAVTFAGLSKQILFIIALSVLAVLTKLIGSGLGAKLTGFNMRSSLIIGAGMVSRGEVALIIATIGLNTGLLLQQYFTSIIIVVIVSTIVTPPLLKILLPKAPLQ